MNNHKLISIDLAKNVFQVCILDDHNNTVKMLGSSNRGNSTLRGNLILGAKAVIRYYANKTDRISLWFKSLLEKKSYNKVAVALANKIARTAWSVLKNKTEFNASNIVTN